MVFFNPQTLYFYHFDSRPLKIELEDEGTDNSDILRNSTWNLNEEKIKLKWNPGDQVVGFQNIFLFPIFSSNDDLMISSNMQIFPFYFL